MNNGFKGKIGGGFSWEAIKDVEMSIQMNLVRVGVEQEPICNECLDQGVHEKMIGQCEYCNMDDVELKKYDLGDGESARGCVDEERCRRQMNYNEWGT